MQMVICKTSLKNSDGWYSVYVSDTHTPVIQADTLQRAKDYCWMTEPLNVEVKVLCYIKWVHH